MLLLRTLQHSQFVIATHTSAWLVCYCYTPVSMVSLLLLHTRQHSQCTLVSMVSLLFLHTCQHGLFVIAVHTSPRSICHCCTLVTMVVFLLLHTRQHGQFVVAAHTSAGSVSFSAHSSAWSVFHCCTHVTMVSSLLLHTHKHGQFGDRTCRLKRIHSNVLMYTNCVRFGLCYKKKKKKKKKRDRGGNK